MNGHPYCIHSFYHLFYSIIYSILSTQLVVVDMFAGLGYFSIPLAKHCQVKSLTCIEKNPDS